MEISTEMCISYSCFKFCQVHQQTLLHLHISIGDSGYGCKPYLMTPLADPLTGQENRYKRAHMGTRCSVERTIGALKQRFRYWDEVYFLRAAQTVGQHWLWQGLVTEE